MTAEWGHLAVLEQDVVEGQDHLAMRRRPVVGVRGLDQDVAVEPQLLAVVLADVRVIPVEPRIGERHPRGEPLAHQHGVLGLMGSVVAVLEP